MMKNSSKMLVEYRINSVNGKLAELQYRFSFDGNIADEGVIDDVYLNPLVIALIDKGVIKKEHVYSSLNNSPDAKENPLKLFRTADPNGKLMFALRHVASKRLKVVKTTSVNGSEIDTFVNEKYPSYMFLRYVDNYDNKRKKLKQQAEQVNV